MCTKVTAKSLLCNNWDRPVLVEVVCGRLSFLSFFVCLCLFELLNKHGDDDDDDGGRLADSRCCSLPPSERLSSHVLQRNGL